MSACGTRCAITVLALPDATVGETEARSLESLPPRACLGGLPACEVPLSRAAVPVSRGRVAGEGVDGTRPGGHGRGGHKLHLPSRSPPCRGFSEGPPHVALRCPSRADPPSASLGCSAVVWGPERAFPVCPTHAGTQSRASG